MASGTGGGAVKFLCVCHNKSENQSNCTCGVGCSHSAATHVADKPTIYCIQLSRMTHRAAASACYACGGDACKLH
jgi:hypothetical protein